MRVDVHPGKQLIITVQGFWECECKDNFVHESSDPECLRCGSTVEESPDARIQNVIPILQIGKMEELIDELSRAWRRFVNGRTTEKI